jgi:sortase (surface protein transpeptidase)
MNNMKKSFLILGSVFWLLALLLAFLPSWPHLYYRLSPETSTVLAQTISKPLQALPTTQEKESTKPTKTEQPKLPPLDLSLPKENGLIIEKIGIRGEINKGEDWQEVLKKGIWLVPNFAIPEDGDGPIILAAHRWGYLDWSNQFRYLNSFYNLPKLEIGDQVLINWNQRQYQYEITKEETTEQITDYSTDLILYTCQLWNSPLRIFKYAKRIN